MRGIRLPAPLSRMMRRGMGCAVGEAGTSAVEFALVAPILLALVFGIIVYGIYFFTWIAVTHAATEGARASVAGLSTSERVTLATNQIDALFSAYAPILDQQNATIVAQQSPSNPGLFQVSITYDFSHFAFGVLGRILPIPNQKPSITVTVSDGGY